MDVRNIDVLYIYIQDVSVIIVQAIGIRYAEIGRKRGVTFFRQHEQKDKSDTSKLAISTRASDGSSNTFLSKMKP